ncbi:hypothetical protein OG814_31950 [Streptomyces zaomyceticus]|uniref:Uncharacterized protein n=1 Tax=Streptomyces zaomyceticus TaxID=68286 RepID=A0ABZ1LGR0_9ACTN
MNILTFCDFMHLGEDPSNLFSLLLDGPLCLPQTLEILGYEDKEVTGQTQPPPGSRPATKDEVAQASLFTVPRGPFDSLPRRKASSENANALGLEFRYISSQPDKVVVFPNDRDMQTRQLMLYTPGPIIGGSKAWQVICTDLYVTENPGKRRSPPFIVKTKHVMSEWLNQGQPTPESNGTTREPCDCWIESYSPTGGFQLCRCGEGE